ncbi:MAG: glycosyltransferase family 9 protein [Deltaproteobacteria bacterium]|nr:glycosyltransferase family 9 protein [Deltaproteobacteria bacterium]
MDLNGKRILIVKLRYIGDTLSIVPVVENLKRVSPGSRLDVLVNRGTEPVVIHHPSIDHTWVYDYGLSKKLGYRSIRYQVDLIKSLRSVRYDVVIDFTHGDRAALICFLTGAPVRVTHCHAGTLSQRLMNRFVDSDPAAGHIVDHQLASLRVLGLEGFEPTLSLHVPGPVRRSVDRRVGRAGLSDDCPWVAVHPGARGELRRWRSERFAELIERLRSDVSVSVLLLGGPGEEDVLEEVQARLERPAELCSSDMSLLELGELLRRCSLFIGNDSAPGHLAAAAGCPTVSLFGPTFPHMWRPLAPQGQVLFKDPPCCGCRQEACTRSEAWCMDLIGVDEVWDCAMRILKPEAL